MKNTCAYRNNSKNEKCDKESSHNFYLKQKTLAQGHSMSENAHCVIKMLQSKTHFLSCFGIMLTGLLSLMGDLSGANRAASLQEGVELRRIGEYCKEKNFHAVKAQILTFLNKHPHSESLDALCAMLGDILFSENDFASALNAYNQIKKEDFKSKIEFRRIHCLHQLGKFEEVITATSHFLNQEKVPEKEIASLRLQLGNALLRQALIKEEREAKHTLLQLSKDQFKLLSKTDYADQALAPLAHIHTFLKEYPQAVKVYQLLAEKESANKEEYLLHILQLQVKFDRAAAIETCYKIYSLGGEAASHAAFNQLSLLFQEKRYRDIALLHDKLLKHVAESELPLAYYYIGRSLHHIGDHTHAAMYLEKYLQGTNNDAMRFKNALFTLLSCAKEIDNLSLFETTIATIKATFPNDIETIKGQILHAYLYRVKGDYARAATHLKELLDSSNELAERDNIQYDYALLLSKDQHWLDSAFAFETFIKQFPAHAHYKSAWRNLIHCQLNAIKASSPETAFVKKEKLCHTLHRALKEKGLFSSDELKTFRFALATTLFDIQKYDSALGELTEYITDYHHDKNIAEAYFLAALSHLKGSKDLDLFASNAEQALSLQPDMPEAGQLHVHLFNAYLSQAERKNVDEKSEMLIQAADHLYHVLDFPIKKQNQLWLADFYFNQYKTSQDQISLLFLDRAIVVLEKILNFNSQDPKLTITADKMEMEPEAIKLAELYSSKKKNPHKINLLRALTNVYKDAPDLPWKYQRLAQFELASAYKEEKQYEKALAAYKDLIESSSYASSYFSIAAALDKTLLEYFLLDPQQKNHNTAHVQTICDDLKDIEIKRKLFSEPCHLEAALSYIDIAASLVPSHEELERRLLLLDQLEMSYSCMDDPLVVQYLSTKDEFPEKHDLYQQYMTLIAADILAAQSLVAHKKGEMDESLHLRHSAQDKLAILSQQAVDPRLKGRIEKSREALK